MSCQRGKLTIGDRHPHQRGKVQVHAEATGNKFNSEPDRLSVRIARPGAALPNTHGEEVKRQGQYIWKWRSGRHNEALQLGPTRRHLVFGGEQVGERGGGGDEGVGELVLR